MTYRHVIVLSNNMASSLSIQIASITKKMAQGGFVIEKSEYKKDGDYSIAMTFAKEVVSSEISQMSKQIEKLLADKED